MPFLRYRTFLPGSAFPSRTFFGFLFALALIAPVIGAASPPNVVFVLADDLGYGDLGCYGQDRIETPNIDRLATEGMRFTQAYAGGPVCTPSRSVLMTGLHAGHTPARDNIPHYTTYLEEDDITLAEVLNAAGYRCGGVGKWSLGDAGTPGRATNQGFDMWFGYLNQDHAHFYYPEYLDDNEGRLVLEDNPSSRHTYSHDLLAERALQFIRDLADSPFFLYAAFTLPHFSAIEEDKDGLTVPTTEPYAGKDWDERAKKYASMVHMLDRDIGRLVALLEELGLSENTLVIFSSDNGGHKTVDHPFDTNGDLRGFKRDLYEGGIRVPLIARWPGTVPAGTTSDEIVAFQDILPTLGELAGLEVGFTGSGSTIAAGEKEIAVDGVSVAAALRGGEIEHPHAWLYWDHGHCRRRYDQAVRLGDWKGIRLGQDSPMELYNLAEDPGEQNSVAAENPGVVQQIEEIMASAFVPNPKYPVGEIYRGGPIWKPGH